MDDEIFEESEEIPHVDWGLIDDLVQICGSVESVIAYLESRKETGE